MEGNNLTGTGKKKLRVGVLFGGKSAEKEVSLATGRYVLNLVDSSRFEAIPLYMSSSGLLWKLPPKLVLMNTTKDVEIKLEGGAEHIRYEDLPQLIDFAFIALLGKYGEDGGIQGILEMVRVPYSGSGILASAVGMHKGVHKRFLRANGITVAEDISLYKADYGKTRTIESIEKEIKARFGFPVIVKPVAEGSSIGVSFVANESELAAALEEALKWDSEILIEEFVKGQEFMCVIIGTHEPVAMLPSEVEFTGNIFTYENKYMPGQAVYHTPIRAPQEKIKEIQDIAVKVCKLLNIQGYGRVDGFLKDKQTVYISEPHTGTIMVPSSYVFQQASLQEAVLKTKGGVKGKAGVKFNPRSFISTIVDLGMADYAEKEWQQHLAEVQTMRVGILFGGPSSEREISLESGRHIYNSLDSSRYEIIPIYVSHNLRFFEIPERLLWMNATADIEKCLETEGKRIYFEDLKKMIDFCFLGLHGKYVEDGGLQGLLETLEIPYNGPRIIGAAIGMDKIFQKQLLKAAALHYPPQVVVRKREYAEDAAKDENAIEKELGFPCVVKPSNEGCSTGISKVNKRSDLKAAIEGALKWSDEVLVEKFMDMMEVTCVVLGNEHPYALLPTETPFKGEFLTVEEKFLPGDAQMITPPRVPEEDVKTMQSEFVKAYKAMNLRVYARIDGFWDTKEKKLYINEPNTLPGVTPSTMVFHQAAEAGMSPSAFFDKLIELSLIEHGVSAKQEALI